MSTMDTPKHTAGRLDAMHDTDGTSQLVACSAHEDIATVYGHGNAERLRDCWNACSGIADPEGAIREAREALRACLASLNIAAEAEGDTFGTGHNDAMDAMDAAERLLAKLGG